MPPDAPTSLLAIATALHAGFQLVVTLVVYPAFAGVSEADWPTYHADHSRRISVVVALVYGLLAVACVWVLVDGVPGVAGWVALVATAVALLLTAGVAAPAHGRLDGVRRTGDMRALLVGDRFRLLAALVSAAAAAWTVLR